MKRLVVVSPRPPRFDGQGDQRRALEIVKALEQEWEVEVVSWLPDVDHPGWRRYRTTPGQLARIGALAVVLPAQVAYVQSLARPARSLSAGSGRRGVAGAGPPAAGTLR